MCSKFDLYNKIHIYIKYTQVILTYDFQNETGLPQKRKTTPKRRNYARLRSKTESGVQSWRPRANAFCDLLIPSVCSAAPVTRNHLSKPKDLMLQNVTLLRKSAPWPPNIIQHLWWRCLLYCACHAKCAFADPLQISHACHRFSNLCKTHMFSSFLARCKIPCACHENDAWTSKSGPNLVCFWQFHLEICFAPQPRACFAVACRFFDSSISKGCYEAEVFLAFGLGNLLRATLARTFVQQLASQKTLRGWGTLRATMTCNQMALRSPL